MVDTMLEINKLDKYFGGLKALEKVSFSVENGIIKGLIGPNGAGKTTLFNTLCGVYKANGGTIEYKRNKIQGVTAHQIANMGIARTFQIARPFMDMTVIENVLVGLGKDYYQGFLSLFNISYKDIHLKKAREILEMVELDEFAEEEAGDLSLGYKRRLGIARALALSPEILMLDEPLAGLGTDAINYMLELILRLKEDGMTIIIIEHNMDAIMKICDEIVVLNQGKKIAEGLPEEIQNNIKDMEADLGKEEGKDV